MGIREGFSEAVTVKLRLEGCSNINQKMGGYRNSIQGIRNSMCKGPGVRKHMACYVRETGGWAVRVGKEERWAG